MRTPRIFPGFLLVALVASVADAQLVQITYEGTYQFGGRGDEPSGDPVPFVANARFDLATPPTERSETFTDFDAAAWSLMHPDRLSTIRWQIKSRDRDVTLPLVSMRVWDDGRFDVGYYSRIPSLTLSLNLDPPLDPDRLPAPPFSFRPDASTPGRVEGGYIIAGNEFVGPVTHVSASFAPVPEPGSYGLAGMILLSLAILVARGQQFLPHGKLTAGRMSGILKGPNRGRMF